MQALGGWLGLGLGLDMPSRNGPPNSSPRLTGTKRKGRRDEGEKEDTHSSPSSSSGTIKQPVKRLMANLSLGDIDDIRTESYASHPLKSTSPHSPETLQDMARYIKLNPHSDNTHEGGSGDINHHADEKRWHIIASEWIKQNINWNTDYYFEVFDPLNVDHYSAMLAFIAKVRGVSAENLVYDPCVFVFMACKVIDPPLADFPTSSTTDKVFEIASILVVRILKPFSNLLDPWESIEEYATENEYPSLWAYCGFNEDGDEYDKFMSTVDLTRGKNIAYLMASHTDDKYTMIGLNQGLRFIAFLFLYQHRDSLNVDGIVSNCAANISGYILVRKFGFKSVDEVRYSEGGGRGTAYDPGDLPREITQNRPFIIQRLYEKLQEVNRDIIKYDNKLHDLDVDKKNGLAEERYSARHYKISSKRELSSELAEQWRAVVQKFYYAYMNDQFTHGIPTKYEEIFGETISDTESDFGVSARQWYDGEYKNSLKTISDHTGPPEIKLKQSSALESLYWRTFVGTSVYSEEWDTFTPLDNPHFQERLTTYAQECILGEKTNFKFLKGGSHQSSFTSWLPTQQKEEEEEVKKPLRQQQLDNFKRRGTTDTKIATNAPSFSSSKLKPIPNYRLLLGEKVGKLVLQNTVPKLVYRMRVFDPNNAQQRKKMSEYLRSQGVHAKDIGLEELYSECLIALVVYTNHNRDGMDFSGNKGFGNPYENDLQAFENSLSNREIVGLLILRIVEPFNSYVDESGVVRILHDTLFRPILAHNNIDEQNDVYYGGKYDPKNVNPELWNQHQPKNVIYISHISAKSTPTGSYSYPEFLPRLLFLFSLKFIINNYTLLNCAAILTNTSILDVYSAQKIDITVDDGDNDGEVANGSYLQSVVDEIFIEAGCPKNILTLDLGWWGGDNQRQKRHSIFREDGLIYWLDGHLGEDWNWFLSFFPKPKETNIKYQHLSWSAIIPLTYDETSEKRKRKGEFYIDGMRTMFNKLNRNFLNLKGVEVSYYDTKDVEAPDVIPLNDSNKL